MAWPDKRSGSTLRAGSSPSVTQHSGCSNLGKAAIQMDFESELGCFIGVMLEAPHIAEEKSVVWRIRA